MVKLLIELPEDLYKRFALASRVDTFEECLNDRHYFCEVVATGIPYEVGSEGEWVWAEEWLDSTPDNPRECDWAGWVCSKCRQLASSKDDDFWDDPNEQPTYDFCPSCGATMKRRTENEQN